MFLMSACTVTALIFSHCTHPFPLFLTHWAVLVYVPNIGSPWSLVYIDLKFGFPFSFCVPTLLAPSLTFKSLTTHTCCVYYLLPFYCARLVGYESIALLPSQARQNSDLEQRLAQTRYVWSPATRFRPDPKIHLTSTPVSSPYPLPTRLAHVPFVSISLTLAERQDFG